jgi:hypothetical protein
MRRYVGLVIRVDIGRGIRTYVKVRFADSRRCIVEFRNGRWASEENCGEDIP